MRLEEGELVLYCGRLAEVLTTGRRSGPAVLEVTDAGGVTHDYTVTYADDIRRLQGEGETVLDALARVATGQLSSSQQLKRLAEMWLAEPRVGDVFAIEHGYHLELTEIWGDGVIVGLNHLPKNKKSFARQQVVSFDNERTLRRFLKKSLTPVYSAAAYATDRPELRGHPLLRKKRGSPLSPVKPNRRRK